MPAISDVALALCPTCAIRETCPIGDTNVVQCQHYDSFPKEGIALLHYEECKSQFSFDDW